MSTKFDAARPPKGPPEAPGSPVETPRGPRMTPGGIQFGPQWAQTGAPHDRHAGDPRGATGSEPRPRCTCGVTTPAGAMALSPAPSRALRSVSCPSKPYSTRRVAPGVNRDPPGAVGEPPRRHSGGEHRIRGTKGSDESKAQEAHRRHAGKQPHGQCGGEHRIGGVESSIGVESQTSPRRHAGRPPHG